MQHIPNLISLLRLLMAPVVAWSILAQSPNGFFLFFVAAWSDALDGWLARWLAVSSALGTYLDPLADKVLVTLGTLAWWWAGILPGWLVAMMLGRDAMILLGSAVIYTRKGRKDFQPSLWGKLSTILQLNAIGACFLFSSGVQNYFFLGSALGTILSGADYARTGWKMLNNELPIRQMPQFRPSHKRRG